MKLSLFVFVAVLLIAVACGAQDPTTITKELNEKWAKKPARLFIATSATDIRVSPDGSLLHDVTPACNRYADVIVDRIKLTDRELRIEATRTALPGTRRYPNFPYDVQVRAKLQPGWTDGDVITLVQWIFTPSRTDLPPLKTGPDLHRHDEPGLERPRAVFTPDAQMTDQARRERAGGNAWVEFTVNENGTVSDVEALTNDPYGLHQAAASIVATWQFKPAMLNGTPVKVRLRSETSFCIF